MQLSIDGIELDHRLKSNAYHSNYNHLEKFFTKAFHQSMTFWISKRGWTNERTDCEKTKMKERKEIEKRNVKKSSKENETLVIYK